MLWLFQNGKEVCDSSPPWGLISVTLNNENSTEIPSRLFCSKDPYEYPKWSNL